MKVRCVTCKKYVLREEAIRTGLVSFCSQDCRYRAAQKGAKLSKGKTRSSKASSRKQRADRAFPEGLHDEVLAADSYRCRFCGKTYGRLIVHHIVYRSNGGKHTLENLITLCEVCHEKIHSNKRLYQPMAFFIIENREKPYTIQQLENNKWQPPPR